MLALTVRGPRDRPADARSPMTAASGTRKKRERPTNQAQARRNNAANSISRTWRAGETTLRAFHIGVKKRNRVGDRLQLHRVGRIDAALVAPDIDEAVRRVLVAGPPGVRPQRHQQIVADTEDALQIVAVAALHEDRRADGTHAR